MTDWFSGGQSPIGHVAAGRALSLLTSTPFEHVPVDDEIIGNSPKILQSGQHDISFYQEMWRLLAASGCWEGEIWNGRKSGEIYPEWLHINAIRDDENTVRYYAGVFRISPNTRTCAPGCFISPITTY